MMNGQSLAKAIEFLDRTRASPSTADLQCRDALYSRIDAELARAEAMTRQRAREARSVLATIDRRYGQLAAPRSLELRARIGA